VGFVVVFGIMLVFIYLLVLRPQNAQRNKQASMLDALKPGDEIITVGGIYGDVVEIQEDRIELEIAEDVHIEVAKRAIAQVVPHEDALSGIDAPEPMEAPEPEPLPQEEAARR
jgi:preprotein translocase subunit YajC